MNNARRRAIKRVITQLESLAEEYKDKLNDIQNEVESIQSDEQDALDNMPESLMGSDRYSAIEEASMYLDEAVFAFDEVLSAVDDSVQQITSSLEGAST